MAPAALALGSLVLASCREPAPSTPSAAVAPRAAVKLGVQVVGDDDLAEGIRLLRGEWKARSGGELEVETAALDQLAEANLVTGDLVVFPSRWLGTLAERGDLQPIRSSVLNRPELGLNDIYPAIRNGEMKYGGQTLALPLGSPPLLMCWRPTVAVGSPTPRWPPATWEEYRRLLGVGSSEAQPTAAPLAGRAAAFTLIARALAYTESQRRSEAFFDAETMAPRITAPPFVRALSEIVEESSVAPRSPPVDFQQGVELVRSGKALTTLGWPNLVREAAEAPGIIDANFAALPVAEQTYSPSSDRWENQLSRPSVTLLGVEGRLIGVSRRTRNAVSALKLAQWLTSGDVAVQLSSRSPGALWYRASQASSYARWAKGETARDSGTPLTQVAADLLATETPIMIPRVPGIDEYLDSLAEAVRTATPGDLAAKAALELDAAKWETITDRLGRESQAKSYRRHLGIDSYEP
jgi:multiple sugar transport system substrate-binding protein